MKKRLFSLLFVLICICSFSLSAFAKSIDNVTLDDAAQIQTNPYLWYFNNQMLGVEEGTGVYIKCPTCGYRVLYTGGTLATCPYDGSAMELEDKGDVKVRSVAPGVGRKDLKGYLDKEKGTPAVGQSGKLYVYAYPDHFAIHHNTFNVKDSDVKSELPFSVGSNVVNVADWNCSDFGINPVYSFTIPSSIPSASCIVYPAQYKYDCYNLDNGGKYQDFGSGKYGYVKSTDIGKYLGGQPVYITFQAVGMAGGLMNLKYLIEAQPILVEVTPDTAFIKKQTNITINNYKWTGNIYQDNSENITYIYPEYTVNNETKISNNPIIYNNDTKQYYTYDPITNNFYYITYNAPSATPTPAPTFKPGGGHTRGGGVSRHPGGDGTNEEDWYKGYYVLNDYDYDCYYGNFYVDNGIGNPYGVSKVRVSTTAIPITAGEYKVTIPDNAKWRAWRWDENAKKAVPVNSETWKDSGYYNFYTSEELIFEFRKIDGSKIDLKKIILRLDNPTIIEYEPGGKKHVDPVEPIFPDEQSYIIPQMNSNNFTDSHGTWIATGSTKYSDQYNYYKAFDRSTSTGWCMGEGSGGKGGRELPCYVQITIPDSQNYYINGYVMRGHKADEYPGAWILQASTDGTDWEDLDTQTAQDLSDFKEHSYSLDVHKAYKYYRMKVTAYPNNYMGIGCFNLLGYNAEDVIIPTPSPSPTPAPTDPPTPIIPPSPGGDNPGGSGSGSGSGSGDNSWNPFKWLTDLLKDIVETILKGLWKLLTSIFGFILWLLSLLFKLFPWMPNSGILALCAGVVVVTVIRIIKFITGR